MSIKGGKPNDRRIVAHLMVPNGREAVDFYRRAFGAQSQVMGVDNLPVLRGVAIASAIGRLVARDAECGINCPTVVGHCIADCDVYHLMVRRPQGWLINDSASN